MHILHKNGKVPFLSLHPAPGPNSGDKKSKNSAFFGTFQNFCILIRKILQKRGRVPELFPHSGRSRKKPFANSSILHISRLVYSKIEPSQAEKRPLPRPQRTGRAMFFPYMAMSFSICLPLFRRALVFSREIRYNRSVRSASAPHTLRF